MEKFGPKNYGRVEVLTNIMSGGSVQVKVTGTQVLELCPQNWWVLNWYGLVDQRKVDWFTGQNEIFYILEPPGPCFPKSMAYVVSWTDSGAW